jgi:hypothetical protein
MNFQNLSVDEKKQLKEYLSSIKEIQSEVGKLLEKCGYKLKENDGKTNPDGNDVINLNAMAPENQPNNHSTNLLKKIK